MEESYKTIGYIIGTWLFTEGIFYDNEEDDTDWDALGIKAPESLEKILPLRIDLTTVEAYIPSPTGHTIIHCYEKLYVLAVEFEYFDSFFIDYLGGKYETN